MNKFEVKPVLPYMSCSESHVAAIGAYGQLYVWGKSFINDDHDDKTARYDCHHMGCKDDTTKEIKNPVYFSLSHPMYKVLATQVSCGETFTAIVAKEKPNTFLEKNAKEEAENSVPNDFFEEEIKDDMDYQELHDMSKDQQEVQKLKILANSIRKKITKFLKAQNTTFLKYFKSKVIKEETFINLMQNSIDHKHKFTEEDLRDFLRYKKMNMPGKGIILKPLYELVMKCRQSQGVLYILGHKEDIIPTYFNLPSSTEIAEHTLMYYLISLPEKVCVAKVACGVDFVILLGHDGDLYSWGSRPTPALGRNSSLTYKNISLISSIHSRQILIKDISVGSSHCLALTSTNTILTWGEGEFGKLGNNRNDNLSQPSLINMDACEVEFIRAGNDSSFCKIDSDTYYVWGKTSGKRFGNDDNLESYNKPTQVEISIDIIDIAIGKDFTVVVTNDNQLYQFGHNKFECLSIKYPNLVGVLFYQVTCNRNCFFALSTKGTIFSWTLEISRQLENSVLGRAENLEVPTEIDSCINQFPEVVDDNEAEKGKIDSSKILQGFCAEENTVLITDKWEVLITGGNKYGQMGIAPGDFDEDEFAKSEYLEFVKIPRLSLTSKVTVEGLACGSYHILAVTSTKKVLAWGENSFGQLGLGRFSKFQMFPEFITSFENTQIVAVSAGKTHSLALSSTGNVFAFGSAENGKLGLGVLKSSILFNNPSQIMSLEKIVVIDCAESHSLAICKEGKLYLWGQGWKGQLGNGLKDTVYEPKPLTSFLIWEHAACGSYHTVGVTTVGKTYHWGQVCMADEELEYSLPVAVKGLEEPVVKLVFAGENHSAALVKNSASIYTWGKQLNGRVLNGKAGENELTRLTNTSIPGEKIISFSISTLHGCLVTDQGNVFTWGCTYGGRTGDKSNYIKAFNTLPIDLSNFFDHKEALTENAKEVVNDLQYLLQNESDELNEKNIREVDLQISLKFKDCIDQFIDLTEADMDQSSFFVNVEHRMLTRLQQDPLNCKLSGSEMKLRPELMDKPLAYSSLITTYQIHTCYLYKLLNLKIEESQKIEFLNLIYVDMENDWRLIYTSLYLAKKLLEKLLRKTSSLFKEFMQEPEAVVYKALLFKIIMASGEDMEKLKKIAESVILSLGNAVHDDVNGIDPDPLHAFKNANNTVTNRITAYQINRNVVDKRMSKLNQVMIGLTDSLRKFIENNSFSIIITFIIRDFIDQCTTKFSLKSSILDWEQEQVQDITHVVLRIIFEPLSKAIEKPSNYYVLVENQIVCSEDNLNSLATSVRAFFSGEKIGKPGERWFTDIDRFNTETQKYIELKVNILKKLLEAKADLEEEFLKSIFVHSLADKDIEVSVLGQSLVSLHRVTAENLEALRVNNPSYDPLVLICKSLGCVPNKRIFSKIEQMNLQLFTRSLRQDQSIVRCQTCEMLIPRDMAPSNFQLVIDTYDPMPPNSPTSLLTKILATGHKKPKKAKIVDYLKQYENVFFSYLKDYKSYETVKFLLNCVDTLFAANQNFAVDTEDIEEKQIIEKNREINLKKIENDCEVQYMKRKAHVEKQKKLTATFDSLKDLLKKMGNSSKLSSKVKKKILFNVEYGASNRELEQFSDSVMFSIFMNKIREYTNKKEMSISLFENLTGAMKKSLRGFMKRNLNELIRKKIVSEYKIVQKMRPKEIVFSFEIDINFLTIIVAYSKNKLNICGRDEFREEELLMYERIASAEIAEMREQCKNSEENLFKMIPENSKGMCFNFSQKALLELIGQMEDRKSAYVQNIEIADTEKKSKHKKKNTGIEIDKSGHILDSITK